MSGTNCLVNRHCRIVLIVPQWEYFPAVVYREACLFDYNHPVYIQGRPDVNTVFVFVSFGPTWFFTAFRSCVKGSVVLCRTRVDRVLGFDPWGSKLFFVRKKKKRKKRYTICRNICRWMNESRELFRPCQWSLYPLINYGENEKIDFVNILTSRYQIYIHVHWLFVSHWLGLGTFCRGESKSVLRACNKQLAQTRHAF